MGYKGSQHFYVLYFDSVGKGLQHFTFVNDIATLMYQSLAVIMYNEPSLAKEEVFQPGSWTRCTTSGEEKNIQLETQ